MKAKEALELLQNEDRASPAREDLLDMLRRLERFEMEEERIRKVRAEMDLYVPQRLWHEDWKSPTEKGLTQLRNALYDYPSSEFEHLDIDDETAEEIERFVEFRGSPEEAAREFDLEKLADIARSAEPEVQEVSVSHVVSVAYSLGGPDVSLDFHVNKDGEMLYAKGVHRNWGTRDEFEVAGDVAESLWERFSHIGEELAEDRGNSLRP